MNSESGFEPSEQELSCLLHPLPLYQVRRYRINLPWTWARLRLYIPRRRRKTSRRRASTLPRRSRRPTPPQLGAGASSNSRNGRREARPPHRRGPPAHLASGYQIVQWVDEGAYGTVWLAVEKATGVRVAVKCSFTARDNNGGCFRKKFASSPALTTPTALSI